MVLQVSKHKESRGPHWGAVMYQREEPPWKLLSLYVSYHPGKCEAFSSDLNMHWDSFLPCWSPFWSRWGWGEGFRTTCSSEWRPSPRPLLPASAPPPGSGQLEKSNSTGKACWRAGSLISTALPEEPDQSVLIGSQICCSSDWGQEGALKDLRCFGSFKFFILNSLFTL